AEIFIISHGPFLNSLPILGCRVLLEIFEGLSLDGCLEGIATILAPSQWLIPSEPQPLQAHHLRHIVQGMVVPPLLRRIQSPLHLPAVMVVALLVAHARPTVEKVKWTRN